MILVSNLQVGNDEPKTLTLSNASPFLFFFGCHCLFVSNDEKNSTLSWSVGAMKSQSSMRKA